MIIVDLALAPRNTRSKVEYNDFYILKPIDLSKGAQQSHVPAPKPRQENVGGANGNDRGGTTITAFMRTTIDLPDDLYRTLKVRAGLSGVTLRQLVQRLIEQGLRSSNSKAAPAKAPVPPPVIIPARGVPIPALSRAKRKRIEEEEDEAKHARLA